MSVLRLLVVLLLVAAGACRPSAGETPGHPTSYAEDEESGRERLRRFWETVRAATAARTAGEHAAAIDLYRKVLEVDPDHADTLHYLAQLLYARGDGDGTRELLVRLTGAETHSLRGWQQLSLLQGMPTPGWVADPAAALASIDRAVEWNPGNSGARALQARWAAYAGRDQAAREALAAALELNPDNPDARSLERWLLVRAHASPAARGRLDAVTTAGIPPGILADVDLDGDGRADLRAIAAAPGAAAALLEITGDGLVEQPADSVVAAWEPDGDRASRHSVWRGAFLQGPAGRRIVLVGGGPGPVRLYEPSGPDAPWRQVEAHRLPTELYGAVLASADIDGDGLTDLLLGNVPGPAGDGAQLWLATDEGGFTRTPPALPAASAALLGDIDGDARTDLVLARRAAPATSGDDAATEAAVLVYLGGASGLELSPVISPAVEGPVADLALLRHWNGVELLVATSGLAPGADTPDHLWLWNGTTFRDVSEELGGRARGATVRILPAADGALRLLRGGLVPGDPRLQLILRPR